MDELVGSLDQDNLRIVVDELGKAFAGSGDDLGRLIDNGNLLLARAEESLPQTLRADHRRADRPRHPGRQPLGDPAVGVGPAAGHRHPGRHRPDLRQLLVNAPDAGRAPAARRRRRPGAGLAGPQPRHPQQGDDPAAGRRRADAGHLPGRGLRRLHRRPRRRRHRCAPTSGSSSTPTTRTPASPATSPPRSRRAPARWPPPTRIRVALRRGQRRDPNPGDSNDETAPNIRGEQNIGRYGGVGGSGPQSGEAGGSRRRRHLDDVLGGLLHANPFTSTVG